METCKTCKRFDTTDCCDGAGFCLYWRRGCLEDTFCSEYDPKTVRGKRAGWVGFGCDEGILWINFAEGKQELERYN